MGAARRGWEGLRVCAGVLRVTDRLWVCPARWLSLASSWGAPRACPIGLTGLPATPGDGTDCPCCLWGPMRGHRVSVAF